MNPTLQSLRLVVLILASAIGKVDAAEPSTARNSDRSEQNKEAVFNYLLDVANSCRKPIRLYYCTVCSKEKSDEFPSVTVQAPGKGKVGLDALRDIFGKNKDVRVTEDSGVIRIWIGEVPTAILQTHLNSFSLSPNAQYTPGRAFYELLNSKDMLAAQEALKYRQPLTYSISLIYPDAKLPHLSGEVGDTTAEQFLDKMAKTWAGEVIIAYGACSEKDQSGEIEFWLEWDGQVGGRPDS